MSTKLGFNGDPFLVCSEQYLENNKRFASSGGVDAENMSLLSPLLSSHDTNRARTSGDVESPLLHKTQRDLVRTGLSYVAI